MRWRSPTKGTSPRTRPSHQFWDGSITQICWWWFFPSGKPTMTGEAKKGICFVLGDHPKQIWGKDVTCKLRVHFILTPTTWATSYFCFSGSTARCQDQTQIAWIRSFSWWMHPLFPALIGWIILNPAFALLIHYPFFYTEYCLNPCSFGYIPFFDRFFTPGCCSPPCFFGRNLAPLSRDLIQLLERSDQEALRRSGWKTLGGWVMKWDLTNKNGGIMRI